MPTLASLALLLLSTWASGASGARGSGVVLWHDQGEKIDQLISESGSPGLQSIPNVDIEAGLYDQDLKPALPDALLAPSNFIGYRKEFGFSAVPDDLLAGVDPRLARTVRQDGVAYGVPIFVSNLQIQYFNRKLAPEPLRELEDLAKAGARPAAIWPFEVPYFLIPFLAPAEAWQVGWRDVRIDSPSFDRAMAYYTGLPGRGWVRTDCSVECSVREFSRGAAPYAFLGGWEARELRRKLGADLGVAPLPTIRGEPMAPGLVTYALIFPNRSLTGPKADALRKLARTLLAEDAQGRLASELDRLPARKASLALAATVSPELSTMFEELAGARPVSNSLEMASLWPALRKTLRTQAIEGSATDAPGPRARKLFVDYVKRYRAYLRGRGIAP